MTDVKMPEPVTHWKHQDVCGDEVGPSEPLYSEAQMKQYGDDRAREALGIAADTCDSTMYIEGDRTISKYGPMTHANVEIKKCADAIRALAKEIK